MSLGKRQFQRLPIVIVVRKTIDVIDAGYELCLTAITWMADDFNRYIETV